MTAPWLSLALKELRAGIREIEGEGDHPRIVEYHATTGRWEDDEVPWCSSFVNWCMEEAGVSRTGSALARSWLAWGKGISHPPVGAVCVLKRGGEGQPGIEVLKAPGHVGFYMGPSSSTEILLLAGNVSNAINVRPYPTSRVLSYRWPG